MVISTEDAEEKWVFTIPNLTRNKSNPFWIWFRRQFFWRVLASAHKLGAVCMWELGEERYPHVAVTKVVSTAQAPRHFKG